MWSFRVSQEHANHESCAVGMWIGLLVLLRRKQHKADAAAQVLGFNMSEEI